MHNHSVHISGLPNDNRCPILWLQRWYVNGDVECFKGLHLPLALLAIIILLACILAIPFTAIIGSKKVWYGFEFIQYYMDQYLHLSENKFL